MGFFNRGGSPTGTPAEKGDNCFGETERLKGNKGKVKKTFKDMGDEYVEVEWTHGPRAGTTESVRQWEVGGTNL